MFSLRCPLHEYNVQRGTKMEFMEAARTLIKENPNDVRIILICELALNADKTFKLIEAMQERIARLERMTNAMNEELQVEY
jgi:hypothetical protein